MNLLEKCYENQFDTKTWYFDQLAKLDLKYSHYIEKILRDKESIKLQIKQEYQQRLLIIEQQIQSIKCTTVSNHDHDNINHIATNDSNESTVTTATDSQSQIVTDNYNCNHNENALMSAVIDVDSSYRNDCIDIDIGGDKKNSNSNSNSIDGQNKIEKVNDHDKQAKRLKKGQNTSKYYQMLVKNGKKMYQCRMCKKTFVNRSSAHVHYIATHTKRFECSVEGCNKCFGASTFLKQHMEKQHKKQDKNQINTCKKRQTKKRPTLSSRMQKSEKRYQCKYCHEKFGYRSSRKRHEKKHTGEKPHMCTICAKKFARKDLCTAHEKSHSQR